MNILFRLLAMRNKRLYQAVVLTYVVFCKLKLEQQGRVYCNLTQQKKWTGFGETLCKQARSWLVKHGFLVPHLGTGWEPQTYYEVKFLMSPTVRVPHSQGTGYPYNAGVPSEYYAGVPSEGVGSQARDHSLDDLDREFFLLRDRRRFDEVAALVFKIADHLEVELGNWSEQFVQLHEPRKWSDLRHSLVGAYKGFALKCAADNQV